MIINLIVEAEELDLGLLRDEGLPLEGQVLHVIPLPVPESGVPASREAFRVLQIEHTYGEEGGVLDHVGATVFVERLGTK